MRENEELRNKVRELEETLDVIRSGEVDAIVVAKEGDRQIYTLEGADHPYRALVENIREGALTLSRTGMILYTNSRFADMVQMSADRIAGTSLLDYVCPEHKDLIDGAMRDILDRSCRSRVRLRQGTGSLPALISMNPLSADEDAKISVVVSDRRKDEDRIQLQARMLDAVGDAVIATDPQGEITYWNNAATLTYGWKPEEILGHNISYVKTPNIPAREAKKIETQLIKGGTWTGEYVGHHRNGPEFPVHTHDAPVFDDTGKLIAIIRVSHDITTEKRAEDVLRRRNDDLTGAYEEIRSQQEKLRQTNTELVRSNESLGVVEEELRTTNDELISEQRALSLERDRVKNLLDIAGFMILALDAKGKVTLINRRGCEILGRPEKEILGKDWVATFIPGRARPEIKKAFRNVIEGDIEGFLTHENPVLTSDGDEREILWNNAFIQDGSGKVTGLLSSGEDITERKHAENELHRHNAMMAAINRVLESAITSATEKNLGDTCLEIARKITGSTFGFIGEIKGPGIEDIAISNPGWDACAILDAGGHRRQPGSFRVHGLYGRVITSGRPLFTNDPHHHPDRIGFPSGHPTLESFLGVPLVHQSKVIGLIAVANRPGGYSTVEQDCLQALSPAIVEAFMLKRAEDELRKKHETLNAAYEEIQANQEKLRQNVEELKSRENQLSDALAEKEILLSGIHLRVKNNLTAFISLLSLEGSYIDTPEGRALKKDLQNRARSMALIHETLYKTRKFAEVDMKDYLTTLVDQILSSYNFPLSCKTRLSAENISLDIGRATPMGLIINELVTNSLKYAFPVGAMSCCPGNKGACTIDVLLTKEDDTYILRFADNGVGLPPTFDLETTKTLGLKLVNFLARHQLRATIEVNTDKGTEFIFRFPENPS